MFLKITAPEKDIMHVLNFLNPGEHEFCLLKFSDDKESRYLAYPDGKENGVELLYKDIGVDFKELSYDEMRKLSPMFSKPAMSRRYEWTGNIDLMPFGINHK